MSQLGEPRRPHPYSINVAVIGASKGELMRNPAQFDTAQLRFRRKPNKNRIGSNIKGMRRKEKNRKGQNRKGKNREKERIEKETIEKERIEKEKKKDRERCLQQCRPISRVSAA